MSCRRDKIGRGERMDKESDLNGRIFEFELKEIDGELKWVIVREVKEWDSERTDITV